MNREQQIRNRLSYTRYTQLAKDFIDLGISPKKVGDALQKVHNLINQMSGYRYNTAAGYASDSIDLIKEEYKNGNKRIKKSQEKTQTI